MNGPRILLTDGTSYKCSVIARYLKKHYRDIYISVIVNKRAARYFTSRYIDRTFYLKDPISSDAFISRLSSLMKDNEIDILIPINSGDMEPLLARRQDLGNVMDYWGNLESYHVLHDKQAFSSICNQLKIPAPKSYTLNMMQAIPESGVVFKPVSGSSARGVKYFTNRNRLLEYASKYNRPFIIQDYIEGTGGGISFFANSGKIESCYLHKRLAEWPISGGSSTMRTEMNHPQQDAIIQNARQIVKHVNWSGFCMLELKLQDNAYYFIEANPRIWGSVGQGLANGVNYFQKLLPDTGKCVGESTKVTYHVPLFFLSMLLYLFNKQLDKLALLKQIRYGVPDIDYTDTRALLGQFIK